MDTLLMVGCGWMGRPYLRRAHDRGLAVAVLDSPVAFTWPQTQEALGPHDRTYPVSGTDDAGWLGAAGQALRDGPVVGVLGFSEPHIVAAALLADELGLPGPGVRAAVTSRNKLMQRECFGLTGLPQPEFLLARSAEDAVGMLTRHPTVVLKPLSSMGSIGVEIATTEEQIRSWVGEHTDQAFLVEEFMDGREYSVEALLVSGEVAYENITAKTTTTAPYRVELAHDVPAQLEPAVADRMRATLREVVRSMGMGTGLVHLELIDRGGVPHIVEIATRTPGDYLLDVIEAGTDVDLYDALIAVLTGRDPHLPSATSQEAPRLASVWFPTAPPGELKAVHGVDEVSALDGVVKIEIDVEPGHRIGEFRSSMDRLGMVVYQAPDAEQLADRLSRIQSILRFDLDS